MEGHAGLKIGIPKLEYWSTLLERSGRIEEDYGAAL